MKKKQRIIENYVRYSTNINCWAKYAFWRIICSTSAFCLYSGQENTMSLSLCFMPDTAYVTVSAHVKVNSS